MRIAPIKLSKFDSSEWNRTAIARGASLRSDHQYLTRLPIKYLLPGSVRTFGVYLNAELVGHFTVLKRGKTKYFVDGLKLDPDKESLWKEAMSKALAILGPGTYSYGWHLSLECPRSSALNSLPGISIRNVQDILVQIVDFKNWANWNDYYRSISENSRRNAAKMVKRFQKIDIGKARGLSALRIIPQFARFRAKNYCKKHLGGHRLEMLARYAVNATLSDSFCLDYFYADEKIAAIQLNQEFGDLTYYLEGAYNPEIGGAAWLLQMHLVEAAYRRNPMGKYILGYVLMPYDEAKAPGLMRARRAMRSSDQEGQLVQFEYNANDRVES